MCAVDAKRTTWALSHACACHQMWTIEKMWRVRCAVHCFPCFSHMLKLLSRTTHTTEEATVYVYDLDVFCWNSLVERITRSTSQENCAKKRLLERHPGQSSYLIKNGRNSSVKPDNHILWVVPGVLATDHQTRALGDRMQTRDLSDHEFKVEPDSQEWLQPFTEGLTGRLWSSTDVSSPVHVELPPPALLLSAHPPAKLTSYKSGGKHSLLKLFPKTRWFWDPVRIKV